MATTGDLVLETTAGTGTGNLTLAAVNGKRRFSVVFSTGGTDVFYYFISHRTAAEWEVGTGHMSDATTLVRDTVLLSSNSNAAVDFSAGTKDVASDIPASVQVAILLDAELTALSGLTSAANKIPRFTGSGTADLLDFLDEDNMASDSATAVPSQQSVKAYADTKATGAQGALADSALQPADIGVSIQAYDADLDTWAGLTPSANAQSLVTAADYAAMRALLDLEIGTDVQAFDADALFADVADVLTAGFTEGITDDGTKTTGTYTPTPESGTLSKRAVNGGAFTLAPYSPPNDTFVRMTLVLTNNASAGAVTTSGFTHVVGEFDTTDTNVFLCDIEIRDVGGTETSTLTIRPQQ